MLVTASCNANVIHNKPFFFLTLFFKSQLSFKAAYKLRITTITTQLTYNFVFCFVSHTISDIYNYD